MEDFTKNVIPLIKDLLLPAIAIVLSIIAIVVSYKQKKLNKKQYQEDHERTRRINAIDVLFKWTNILTAKNATARKFAEDLSEENLKYVLESKGFSVRNTEKNKRCVEILFSDRSSNCGSFNFNVEKSDFKINMPIRLNDIDNEKTDVIKISSLESASLRWELISYLNALEFVLVGWVDNVVDREIIESEFMFLFDHYNGGLRKVREILRGSYPCIDCFEEEMLKKQSMKIKEKIELGK